MNDCFWWKLLAGVIAFGLAFCMMTVIAFYNDVMNNNEKIIILREEICRLNRIIGSLTDVNRACYIPSYIIEGN